MIKVLYFERIVLIHILRSLFLKNEALKNGGGIYLYNVKNTTINECIFYGNSAEMGAAIYFKQTGYLKKIMPLLTPKKMHRFK